MRFNKTYLLIGSGLILAPLILYTLNKVSTTLFVTSTAIGIFIVIANILFPPPEIYEDKK